MVEKQQTRKEYIEEGLAQEFQLSTQGEPISTSDKMLHPHTVYQFILHKLKTQAAQHKLELEKAFKAG